MRLTGALFWCLLTGNVAIASEPPRLPPGLGKGGSGYTPALPTGLHHDGVEAAPHGGGSGETSTGSTSEEPITRSESIWDTVERSGFLDARAGIRTQDDPRGDQVSLGEARLQLRFEKPGDRANIRLVTDVLYDPVQDPDTRYELHLYKNKGFLDLREAAASFHVSDHFDLKIGRQILTWGTGDMLFVNDLFPKDWQSFFIGRDVDYLKAPTNAIKVSLFSRFANLDIVYTPRFVADRYLDGSRLSFFSPPLDDFTGQDNRLRVEQPDDWFSDDEIATRIYRMLGSHELAAYGYRGYWKRPMGYEPATDRYTFPMLSVYGASVRGPMARGIGNIEIGYYHSRDDRDGIDPGVPNSEFRFLVGYEQEAARNFSVGLQYYLEYMQDYDAYQASLPDGTPERAESRHLLTLRLTYLALQQDLVFSLFNYWSPSDDDGYIRPHIEYKLDDQWTIQTGANWFFGEHKHTFFGQLQDNTNVYLAMRYNFAFD